MTEAVSSANNSLGATLLAAINASSSETDNIFISAPCILTAMAMAASGANGSTRDQILHALGLTRAGANFSSAVGELQQTLNRVEGVKLACANNIFPANKLSLKETYMQTMQRDYKCAPETLDYSDTEAARTKINMWVADHTHNLITELFRQGGITRDAMMTIVSAIYFKGDWATPFKAELTEKASFVVEGGDKVDAPTMRQSGQFPHRFSDNFNVVRLPYAGDEVAMDIFVPVGSETVRGLISKNVFTFGIEHLDDFKNSKIDLSMPSFKIEYLVELNAYLQQLGMVDAFGSSADFSEMATGGQSGCNISMVIHKTYVEVDEKGTKAAAVTGATKTRGRKPPTQEFKVDRSFVFSIVHIPTSQVLFAGKVADPTRSM